MADEKQQDDYIEIKIPQEEQQPAVKPAPEPSVESKPEPSEKKEPVKKTVNKPITPKKKTAKKKTSKKAAKPVPVKTAKKKAAKKKQQNSSSWLWIVLLFIGLVVIAAVIYLSLQSTPTQEEVSEEDYAVALVNDEAIYASELNQIYDELPDQVKVQTSKEDVLNQLIEQRLLLQEAEKQGITVTQEELAKYNADLMAFFGITEEQLGEILLQQGITKEEFDDSNREQIIVT